MYKLTTVLLAFSALFFMGCATTPESRFPEFYAAQAQTEKLNIVLDSVVLSDINARDIGFNKGKNAVAKKALETAALAEFKNLGYEPQILLSATGLYHHIGTNYRGDDHTPSAANAPAKRPNKNVEYYFSKKFKSTGELFTGFTPDQQTAKWASGPMQKFMQRLSERAPYATSKPKPKKNAMKPIDQADIPEPIKNLNADRLVIIKAYTGEMSKVKSASVGLLSCMLSASLTSGAYSKVPAAVAGSTIEIIVFNQATGTVEWHNAVPSIGYKNIKENFKAAIQFYPSI